MTTVAVTEPQDRQFERLVRARRAVEGEGIEIRRAVPVPGLDAVGPFIFLDHFGPLQLLSGQAPGVPAHPHAGIETLTYLLSGEQLHRDSLGNVSRLATGETQWMRAGRGIVHSEMPTREFKRDGGVMHGVQLWIDMPPGHKQDAPAFRHVSASQIPDIALGGAHIRLVAGQLEGHTGPLTTLVPLFFAHLRLEPGTKVALPTDPAHDLGVYALTGSVIVGDPGQALGVGELAQLSKGDRLVLRAEAAADLLLLGGAPHSASLVRHGPFVTNTLAEMKQAVDDYLAGRMGRIEAEDSGS